MIDFLTPLKNGVTKYMLDHGLKTMLDIISGNMAFRKGKWVFELDIQAKKIEIVLVFLANSDESFCVWKLVNSELIINSFNNLSDYIEKEVLLGFEGYYIKGSISSFNPDYNYSHFLIDNLYDVEIPYGKDNWTRTGAHNTFLVLSSRNNYVYPAFDITEEQEYDDDLGYLTYAQGMPPPVSYPWYICSGRHNWMVVGGILRKNIELWAINSTTAQFKWEENGEVVWGNTLPFLTTGYESMYLATIGCDMFIGKVTCDIYEYSELYPVGGCDYPVALPKHEHYESADKIVFGNCVIFSGTQFVDIEFAAPIIHSCTDGPPKCGIYYEQELINYTYILNNDSFRLQAYDHLDNSDSTFIVFYTVNPYYVLHRYNGRRATVPTCTDPGFVAYQEWDSDICGSGDSLQNLMSYRCKGGNVHNVALQTYGYITRGGGRYQMIGDQCLANLWQLAPITDAQGYRVWNPSCIIVDNYMLYTYQLYNYIGELNDPIQYPSLQAVNWEFEKRILGIINIDTEERTEYEVTEAMEAKGVNWNAELSSAIGVFKTKI